MDATRALLLASALLAGCASADMAAGETNAYDTGVALSGGEFAQSIRVDVLPAGGTDALPQSAVFGGDDWSGLSVELAPTVTWSGRVTGFVANPFDITVPGEASVPVSASVEALVVGERAGAAGVTADGEFRLDVPAGRRYRASVVPDGVGPLPFLVLEDFDLSTSLRGDELDLGAGQPVYGQVLQTDGQPLPKPARARLEHVATGVGGPWVDVDDDGHFLLRALPDDYRVVVAGRSDSSYVPRMSALVTVPADEPVRVDLDAGRLAPVEVDGQIASATGDALSGGVTVRFLSRSLRDTDGTATVTPFLSGDSFRADLLPGTWALEVIPDFDATGLDSPALVEGIVVGDEDLDLGVFALPGRVEASGVVASGDEPVADVLVTAREVGFDQNAWSTRTDADGRYALVVPDVALDVTFAPTAGGLTTTWESVDDPRDLGDVRLAAGQPVDGVVTLDGDPVAYAVVEVRDGETGALYGTAFTDADGGFALRIDHQGSVGDVSQPGVDTGGLDGAR